MLSLLLVSLGQVGGIEPPAYVAIEPPSYAQKHAKSPKRSSVHISVDLGNGRSAAGTGTVIASEGGHSLIITNAHVVESGERPIRVTYWHGGEPWVQPATYVGGSPVAHRGENWIEVQGPDLAIIEVHCDLQPVQVSKTIPATGSPVAIYGFGGASETDPSRKAGAYSGDADFRTMAGMPVARTTIATANGDSGAGVLNAAGDLVAVHWGGGAVRLDTIHSFTVRTLRASKRCLFPRLRDRLAARRIARALVPIIPAATAPPQYCPNGQCPATPPASPPAASFEIVGGCANGQCPAPRARWWRRR